MWGIMASGASVSVRLVARLLSAAAALGADPAAIAADCGLSPEALADKDGHVAQPVLLAVWEAAGQRTGDRAFAIHAAELARRSPDNVLAYAFQHSRSLRDGLRRIAKYMGIAHRGVELVLLEEGDDARLRVVVRPGLRTSRHGPEFTLALACIAGHQYVQAFAIREVSFQHPPPEDCTEHRRVFGPGVSFGRPENELRIDRALLEAPLRDADANLCSYLERHLEELLARAIAPALVDRARRAITDGMRGGGTLGVDEVAARLHMSARSLQRRLKHDGVLFNQLADEVRRDLAMAYLAEPKLSVGEVAFLLGFAEVSTFHRAFKRWTGGTPANTRRMLQETSRAAVPSGPAPWTKVAYSPAASTSGFDDPPSGKQKSPRV